MGAIKTMRIVKELMEIWPNEVCDTLNVPLQCLEAWRYYLEGAKLKFEIWTDHKNLQYFMTNQKLNQRQMRWALYLSWFNFLLKHVSGKSMGKADELSRRPDWQEGVEKDNEDQKLIKPE